MDAVRNAAAAMADRGEIATVPPLPQPTSMTSKRRSRRQASQ